MSDPPVPVVSQPKPPEPEIAADFVAKLESHTRVCANCGAPLGGEYCAACGQRHEPHVHTLGHFASEALESISHADSRLWITLGRLLMRPGYLTREFFAGHRVRYLPPFRLYLVLSVIFFLLTAISGGDDPDPLSSGGIVMAPGQAPAATPAEPPPQGAARLAPAANAAPDPDVEPAKDGFLVIDVDTFDDFCAPFEVPDRGGGSRAARDNIRRFCARVRDNGAALGEAVVRNIPRAMFVFLPLLAAVMKLLYWRPKRYYVEHLLFMVHNHAAVFLVFSLVALLSLVPWVGKLTTWYFIAAVLYMAWYIFRAMRHVYGQGWWLTFAKYFFLFWTYMITAFVSLLLTLVFTAIAG
jgi:hypothetical protein